MVITHRRPSHILYPLHPARALVNSQRTMTMRLDTAELVGAMIEAVLFGALL